MVQVQTNKKITREAEFVDRRWVANVRPDAVFVLAQHCFPGTLILTNEGPGVISVNSGYLEDVIVKPGQTRIVKIRDKIQFGAINGMTARVLFNFLPA
jgi:hypothetical protein